MNSMSNSVPPVQQSVSNNPAPSYQIEIDQGFVKYNGVYYKVKAGQRDLRELMHGKGAQYEDVLSKIKSILETHKTNLADAKVTDLSQVKIKADGIHLADSQAPRRPVSNRQIVFLAPAQKTFEEIQKTVFGILKTLSAQANQVNAKEEEEIESKKLEVVSPKQTVPPVKKAVEPAQPEAKPAQSKAQELANSASTPKKKVGEASEEIQEVVTKGAEELGVSQPKVNETPPTPSDVAHQVSKKKERSPLPTKVPLTVPKEYQNEEIKPQQKVTSLFKSVLGKTPTLEQIEKKYNYTQFMVNLDKGLKLYNDEVDKLKTQLFKEALSKKEIDSQAQKQRLAINKPDYNIEAIRQIGRLKFHLKEAWHILEQGVGSQASLNEHLEKAEKARKKLQEKIRDKDEGGQWKNTWIDIAGAEFATLAKEKNPKNIQSLIEDLQEVAANFTPKHEQEVVQKTKKGAPKQEGVEVKNQQLADLEFEELQKNEPPLTADESTQELTKLLEEE